METIRTLASRISKKVDRKLNSKEYKILGGAVKRFGIELVNLAVKDFELLKKDVSSDIDPIPYIIGICKGRIIKGKDPSKKTDDKKMIEDIILRMKDK